MKFQSDEIGAKTLGTIQVQGGKGYFKNNFVIFFTLTNMILKKQ